MKILVGLSWGVDSAVSAYLLKEAGHEVHAGFMVNYQSDDGDCTTAMDLQEAAKVAEYLQIPFSTFDFIREYEDRIIATIYSGYLKGITPNPDVLCNNLVKFDLFLEEALGYGFDAIATGHYARTILRDGKIRLLKGIDPEKDQSYFLSRLSVSQLERAIFPLGGMEKTEVRKIAHKIGLPNAHRKDSQGLCFIGKVPMREFLRKRIPEKKGDIFDTAGKKVGEHSWAWFYTIGQRRDIRVGGGPALFVVGKDVSRNHLTVGTKEDLQLFSDRATIHDWKWTSEAYAFPWQWVAKIRYRQEDQGVTLCTTDTRNPWVLDAFFDTPQRAISPGQFLVAYSWEELVGSWLIEG